eukprot:scaffold1034_cov418-Prasinococcus_capsulatus_cf.AAC.17
MGAFPRWSFGLAYSCLFSILLVGRCQDQPTAQGSFSCGTELGNFHPTTGWDSLGAELSHSGLSLAPSRAKNGCPSTDSLARGALLQSHLSTVCPDQRDAMSATALLPCQQASILLTIGRICRAICSTPWTPAGRLRQPTSVLWRPPPANFN